MGRLLQGVSPGAARVKVPGVRDVVGDGCGYGETAPSSPGLRWMRVRHRMSFPGLGSREVDPQATNPDTHLSTGSQGEDSSGQRCGRDGCESNILTIKQKSRFKNG